MANREAVMIEEPRIARLMFADTRFAWLWLPLRLYLGWAWWEAGWHKFVDPKWIDGGQALLEYWQRGLKMTPKPVIAFDWYRSFIEFLVNSDAHVWLSKIMLFAIATWLVLAWRNAGWIGLDRWLLPLVGTPWKSGRLFRSPRTAETT
jgi:thiosulfate dehydrogenase [quinone] large subunit